MSRLPSRLRFAAAREQRCPSLQIEAADEIDQLESEIDRLTSELAEAKARAGSATASLPDGWVAVPVEPTQDMLRAMASVPVLDYQERLGIYRAMLSARPEFPPNGLPKESDNE